MISAEQLRQIAALPDSADFRFERRFGETVVNVTYANGSYLSMHEDGSHFVVTPSGATYTWGWERCVISIDDAFPLMAVTN